MVKLYRFQPAPTPADNRICSLERGKIWFSDPEGFNDVLDLKPKIENRINDRWSDQPEFLIAIREALSCLLKKQKMYQQALFADPDLMAELEQWVQDRPSEEKDRDQALIDKIKARNKKFGVLCLTRLLDNRLMWAHYADSHKGFCIEYEVNPFAHVEDIQYIPVQYTSELPELCISEAMFTPHQFLQNVLAIKHTDWAYEQEVRLVHMNKKACKVDVNEDFVKMTGVIAGEKMSDENKKCLRDKATELDIQYFKCPKDYQRERQRN